MKSRAIKFILASVVLMLCVVVAFRVANGEGAAAVPRVERGVLYATVDGQPLHLDLAEVQVEGAKPMPLVVCVHGGGWSSGDRGQMAQMALGLAGQGYCAVTVDYRLSQQAKFPAQLVDVKRAIKYMLDHAKEYNLDPTRVGVIGGSAGGHLALMVATTDSQIDQVKPATITAPPMVRAAISMAGPTDLTREFAPWPLSVVQGLVGTERPKGRDAKGMASFENASPITFISAASAPVLMVHGDSDEVVPYNQAEILLAQAKKVGAQADLVTIHGGKHGGGGSEQENQESVRRMIDFFARYLKQ